MQLNVAKNLFPRPKKKLISTKLKKNKTPSDELLIYVTIIESLTTS